MGKLDMRLSSNYHEFIIRTQSILHMNICYYFMFQDYFKVGSKSLVCFEP